MQEAVAQIDSRTGKPVTEENPALPEFCYENGYTFFGTDLGGTGVKIELVNKHEGGGAIILPPNKAEECANWLLGTLAQKGLGLPKELPDVLARIVSQKGLSRVLKRGDKKKIKDALRVLKKWQSRN